MAPVTRKAAHQAVEPLEKVARPNGRDRSWQYERPEGSSEESDDASADDMMYVDGEDLDDENEQAFNLLPPSALLQPEHYEEAFFPLKVAADRVGREVEKFAEQLDRLNPRKYPSGSAPRHRATFDLINEYRHIAREAVERLGSRHAPKRQKQVHRGWHQRVKDIKGPTSRDPTEDVSEPESEDEAESSLELATYPTETTVEDLQHWEREEQTWDLLHGMLDIQYPPPSLDPATEKQARLAELGEIHRFSSEQEVWEHFLVEDDTARERQVVLTWVKDNAERSGKDIDLLVEQLEGGADRGRGLWAHGWLYTREAIKAQKRLRSWPQPLDPDSPGIAASLMNADRTESLVTQLDPDAVTRQSHVLEKADEYFERAIWLACWEMLRRGRDWSEIREWCQDRVEGWRGASMRGMIPTSFSHRRASSIPNGSTSRALWRRMCAALSQNGGIDDYERAVYGVLSGDLASVHKVCRSWDDFIFAHYNSLLLGQFDVYLRRKFPDRCPPALTQQFGVFDSVFYHGEPDTAGRRVVEHLKVHKVTKDDATQPLTMLQGVLVGKNFRDFIYHQGLFLAQVANRDDYSKIIPAMDEAPPAAAYIEPDHFDGLRVLAHMLLLFQDLGLDVGSGNREIAAENIIVAYIDFLRLAGKLLMIPVYAARLSPERQWMTLSRVLLDETASSTQRELIALMYGLGINVPKVVDMQLRLLLLDLGSDGVHEPEKEPSVVNAILDDSALASHPAHQIKSGFMGDEISPEDRMLIRSFEWFLLVDGCWNLTFEVGALLYRRFFGLGHLSAARDVLARMPSSQISLAKSGAILGTAVDVNVHMPEEEDEQPAVPDTPRTTRATRHRQQADERARRKAGAEHRRLTAEVLATQAKTFIQLEQLAIALVALEAWKSTIDRVASNTDSSKAKKVRGDVIKATDDVISAVQPLLEGWLVGLRGHDDAEFVKLRNAYLPNVILAYNSVLQYAGNSFKRDLLLRSMELSALVAAEGSDLLPCFIRSGRLQDLVTSLAMTSKSMLKAQEKDGKKRSSKKVGMGASLGMWNVESTEKYDPRAPGLTMRIS